MELEPTLEQPYRHLCRIPWPIDPEVPEGHICECGRHWVYQPARWEPLLTLEELRLRQEAGEFLRGIIPTFHEPPSPQRNERPSPVAGELLSSGSRDFPRGQGRGRGLVEPESAVIVRIPRRKRPLP
jgi:hypothetical protein